MARVSEGCSEGVRDTVQQVRTKASTHNQPSLGLLPHLRTVPCLQITLFLPPASSPLHPRCCACSWGSPVHSESCKLDVG